MNILTVGNSPYNNTSNSSIHADLLRYLKKQGHSVLSASWHHVSSYYMAEEDGKFYFDDICTIVPLPDDIQKVNVLYDSMKGFFPDVVISIGNYYEVDFIAAIKRMYPHLFKWISVLTISSLPINPSYKESLEYLDYAIVTSEQGLKEFREFSTVSCEYIPFRPDRDIIDEVVVDSFNVIACMKNSQQSNLGALLYAANDICSENANIGFYIHTNVDDDGDYDLDLLKERLSLSSQISFPTEFVSFYDGIPHNELMQRVSKASVFVDCSMTAATGVSAFEAALQGCIPLVTETGAHIDLLRSLSMYYPMHYLRTTEFLGEREGILHIVSQEELYKRITGLYEIWNRQSLKFSNMRKKIARRAKGLVSEKLVSTIEVKAVELRNIKYPTLIVDFFGKKKELEETIEII